MGFYANDHRHAYDWAISLNSDFKYEIYQRYFIDDIEQTPTIITGTYQVLGNILKMENFQDTLVQLGSKSSQFNLPMMTIVGNYEATFRAVWFESDLFRNPLCP